MRAWGGVVETHNALGGCEPGPQGRWRSGVCSPLPYPPAPRGLWGVCIGVASRKRYAYSVVIVPDKALRAVPQP